MMHTRSFLRRSAFTAFIVFASLQARAADIYEANLAPSPVDETNKADLGGRGTARATLEGNKLTISGNFSGMPSAAVDAHIQSGDGIGVPGNPLFDLAVSNAPSGTVSGTVILSSKQVALFKSGKFYVQVNSVSAKPPFGALWGWLLPPHEKVEADSPQLGSWYMPPHGPGLRD